MSSSAGLSERILWGRVDAGTTVPVCNTSRRSSGTFAFETSSWGAEIIALVSEAFGRTTELFASGIFTNSVWRQKVNNRQAEGRSEGTHLDDATNPIETRLPGRDYFIVILCTAESGEHTPFTFLDDIPLDLNRGATIATLMNKPTRE